MKRRLLLLLFLPLWILSLASCGRNPPEAASHPETSLTLAPPSPSPGRLYETSRQG